MSRDGMGVMAMSDSDDSWESDTGEDVEGGERTKVLVQRRHDAFICLSRGT